MSNTSENPQTGEPSSLIPHSSLSDSSLIPHPSSLPNPYVGPRSFREGEKLYGRERETAELRDLFLAERIVLLHSPSGAGKTSLIQAKLLPELRAEGFAVRPVLRVSDPDAAAQAARDGGNRYLLSVAKSLRPKDAAVDAPLAGNLEEALAQAPLPSGAAYEALIFDQFEEVLTLDPTDLDAKRQFFEQIGVLLRNTKRWALFSLREEYVAALAPYKTLLPTRLNNTFRLGLLEIISAKAAVQEPARANDVAFTNEAAEMLLKDLCQVRVQQPDGTVQEQPGPFVEPVHLQVVCRELWDDLPPGQTTIEPTQITACGDVNAALRSFYDKKVRDAAQSANVPERTIREWFGNTLITAQGLRGQVMHTADTSQGLANDAIRLLDKAHLVRTEPRRGATWYELAHDRLIRPVQMSNADWFQTNLSPFQRQSALWGENDERPDRLLLLGPALAEAEIWRTENESTLTAEESLFLDKCRAAEREAVAEREELRRQAETERRQKKQSLIANAAMLALLFLAAGFFIWGWWQASGKKRTEYIADMNLAQQAWQRSNLLQLRKLLAKHKNDDKRRGWEWFYWKRLSDLAENTLDTGAKVNALALAPDGQWLLQGGVDGTVKLWHLPDWTLTPLGQHPGAVLAVAYAPSGRLFAAAGKGGVVRIWDAATKAQLQEIKLPGVASALSFTPDSQRLAVGTWAGDGTVKVLDTNTWQTVQTIKHGDSVQALAFAPDGVRLATGGDDRAVKVWDATNRQAASAPKKLNATVSAVAWSTDGRWLAAGGIDGVATVWDTNGDAPTRRLLGHRKEILTLAFAPDDGNKLATGSSDRQVKIWDVATASARYTLRGHQDSVAALVFAPQSQRLYTGGHDASIITWQTTQAQEYETITFTAPPVATPSATPTAEVTLAPDQLEEPAPEEAADALTYTPRQPLCALAASPDGARLLIGSDENTARLWDVQQRRVIAEQRHRNIVRGVAFDPTGRFLATADDSGNIKVWRAGTGEVVQTFTHRNQDGKPRAVRAIAFAPDGKLLAWGGFDGSARVLETQTWAEIWRFAAHEGRIFALAFAPDSRQIATGGGDKVAKLWDAKRRQLVATLSAEGQQEINTVAFAPDGKLLATGSKDRRARLYDTDTGKVKSRLEGHLNSVAAIAFTPDGRRLATGSYDNTVKLWELETGQEILNLEGHEAPLRAIAFAPDSLWLASGGEDGTVKLWFATSPTNP